MGEFVWPAAWCISFDGLVEVFGLFVLDFPLLVMDFIICLGVYTDVFSNSLSQWSLACSSVSNLM